MSRTWGLVRDSASLEGQRKRETLVRKQTHCATDRFLHEMHEHGEILGPGEQRHAGECGNDTILSMSYKVVRKERQSDTKC